MSEQQVETFGQRLNRLLRESDRSQVWLVKQAKLSSSVVSRLVRGDRLPTLEQAAAIAVSLGTSVDELTIGTDAEQRIADASQFVSRVDFESVHRLLMTSELQAADLASTLRQTQTERCAALQREKELRAKLDDAERQNQATHLELVRCREQLDRLAAALGRAATDVAVFRGKLSEAQAAAGQNNRARLLATLASLGTVGLLTAADYLRKD